MKFEKAVKTWQDTFEDSWVFADGIEVYYYDSENWRRY